MPAKKGAKGKKKADANADANPALDVPTAKEAKEAKGKKRAAPTDDEGPTTKKVKDSQRAPNQDFVFPPDEECRIFPNQQVYIDDDLLVWDAFLNQTNSGNNNNKFYVAQVVQNAAGNSFKCWTRWGRNGEMGQSKVLGDGTLDTAVREFEKKFKDKSGHRWEDRGNDPKSGKYFFIQRKYEDKGDRDPSGSAPMERRGSQMSTGTAKSDVSTAKCTLDPAVMRLMELIFDKNLFASTLSHLEYDASRVSLRDLDDSTINKAFAALKTIAEVLNDPTVAQSKHGQSYQACLEHQTNVYFSFIPHSFGRRRAPIINNDNMLKREIELLDSLTEMKVADQILEDIEETKDGVHPLDRQYQSLNMKEMVPLDSKSSQYKLLSDYLSKSTGRTHGYKYKVKDIFQIQRQDEIERFDASPYADPGKVKLETDRRLLWHGSRATNFGGILSQGLRIAPPEAPVSGYMFGKGIYLADMSSKSAGYTSFGQSNNEGLLLLCESELGSPMLQPDTADYNAGERVKEEGVWSTWGRGSMYPGDWIDAGTLGEHLKGIQMPDPEAGTKETDKTAGLLYNEYIVYDVAQIKLRYLFRVEISY